MMKFQRPVQSHGEYAGCYVPALSPIMAIANRMLDEDIGITGFDRLRRHLKNVDGCVLFDEKDVSDAHTVALKIVSQLRYELPASITLDDVGLLWYMDQCAMYVSVNPTAHESRIYDYYQNRLLREMKTFMVTYKQALMRYFLTLYTNSTEQKLAELAADEKLDTPSYLQLLGGIDNAKK